MQKRGIVEYAKDRYDEDFLEQDDGSAALSAKDCGLCEGQPKAVIRLSNEALQKKYFEPFNFYFAKPINEILANVRAPHVLMFKDFLYFDDGTEYLKRWYTESESAPRIQALTSFYSTSYKETRPNLSVVESARVVLKRNQRLEKVWAAKQGGEGYMPPQTNRGHGDSEEDDDDEEEQSRRGGSPAGKDYDPILPQTFNDENGKFLPSNLELNEKISFESEPYNIYEHERSSIALDEGDTPLKLQKKDAAVSMEQSASKVSSDVKEIQEMLESRGYIKKSASPTPQERQSIITRVSIERPSEEPRERLEEKLVGHMKEQLPIYGRSSKDKNTSGSTVEPSKSIKQSSFKSVERTRQSSDAPLSLKPTHIWQGEESPMIQELVKRYNAQHGLPFTASISKHSATLDQDFHRASTERVSTVLKKSGSHEVTRKTKMPSRTSQGPRGASKKEERHLKAHPDVIGKSSAMRKNKVYFRSMNPQPMEHKSLNGSKSQLELNFYRHHPTMGSNSVEKQILSRVKEHLITNSPSLEPFSRYPGAESSTDLFRISSDLRQPTATNASSQGHPSAGNSARKKSGGKALGMKLDLRKLNLQRDGRNDPISTLRQAPQPTEENSYGFWTSRSTRTQDSAKRIPISSDYLDYFMANKFGNGNDHIKSQATMRTLGKDAEFITSSQPNLRLKMKAGESHHCPIESKESFAHQHSQGRPMMRKEVDKHGTSSNLSSKLNAMRTTYMQPKGVHHEKEKERTLPGRNKK